MIRGSLLKYIVTNGRETMSEEEADDMLKELGVEPAVDFKITDFIRLILSNMNNY